MNYNFFCPLNHTESRGNIFIFMPANKRGSARNKKQELFEILQLLASLADNKLAKIGKN